MKTIVTVTGIRPDFIRMSEIIKKLDNQPWCKHVLIHTGQHYDDLLSGVFFNDLNIRDPDYNLCIGGNNKSHYEQQAELGPRLIQTLVKNNINPDIILFLGDSNSVLASVPLRKEGYKIGHIEAGMRSYDERMLEEINRKVCDHVSNYLFVYHDNYKQKAIKEGISENKIYVVGNTIIEPLLDIADLNYNGNKKHIILDIHRPENFNHKDRLEKIIKFANLCNKETGVPIKMLKFNRTIKNIKEFNLNLGCIELVDLMGYKKFVRYMQDSLFIVSDSGTAQEEPALLGIPVIVPRDYTERPESIENNNSILLDLNNEKNFLSMLEWATEEKNMNISWLGSGETSHKIVKILKEII